MLNHCFSAYVKPYEPRINMNKQPHQPPCSSADPFLPEVVVRRCQRLSVAQGMLLWTCARHREIFGIRKSIGVRQKSLGKSRENPWTFGESMGKYGENPWKFGESRENMGKIHENSENLWGKYGENPWKFGYERGMKPPKWGFKHLQATDIGWRLMI